MNDPRVAETKDPEKPAVVLLHGWPTSSHLWRDLVPMVSPWMRPIAPDLTDPCDLEGSAVSVRALLDDLSIERFAVVGHAEGAAIAQILAVRGGVEAMVLIDAVALDVVPGSADGTEGSLHASVRHAERLTEDAINGFLKIGPTPTRSVNGAPPGLDELGRLQIPTLVLWGEDDAFLPVELAERLGDALPRASVAVLPGCGHLVTEDAPETVLPLVFQYLRSMYLHTPHAHEEGPVTVQIGRHPPEESFRW
ncbi:MAG: alpha/beta hydrolase [Actinobacteria bacterium]|nr:alpha/beta hydrolase [Actinomycetota bacterium]